MSLTTTAYFLNSMSNNTFIGTTLAGVVIAYFGLYLYKRQKSLDIDFDDVREIRRQSSLLFTKVDNAVKSYNGLLNTYDGTNEALRELYEQANQRTGNYMRERTEDQLNQLAIEIQSKANDLASLLKMQKNEKYHREIENITETVPSISIFLSGSFSVPHSTKENLKSFREEFQRLADKARETLQRLIEIRQ